MKLRYFGYFLREKRTQQKFLYNIKPIIEAFDKFSNSSFKKSFKQGDDHLYLTSVELEKNLFYFVRTTDSDSIIKIDEDSLKVEDILDGLSAQEKAGFASHVYFSSSDCVIACASGTGCPRVDALASYFNRLFNKIEGLDGYELELVALTNNTKRKDLLELEMVNSIYVDLSSDKRLGRILTKSLFGNDAGIGNLKITVEPTGVNLKSSLKGILDKTNKSNSSLGVEAIGAKGKHDELRGQLQDYWLENENVLADVVNPRLKRKSLHDQINEKVDANGHLTKLYNEFVDENSLKLRSANTTLDLFKEVKQFSDKIPQPVVDVPIKQAANS